MTIDKAIEILKDCLHRDSLDFPIDMHAATRLGIEALKREKKFRKDSGFDSCDLLPGETE